ncbi:AGC family protein kinase [Tritrichomonas foetus]|uniref:non-specific serine/threonine protein kinase n=1 Tax=Tritrichomonas foetus TaxID=1144522 RepID=A0A1J4JCV6_9EUKA|nr:AGC family protein kinase [Tritrichomonas foetus]|eukprot:OHS97014.1 AGC family protein kinase [Tritrichomonas foetus]
MESFRVIKKIGQGGYGRAFLVESLEDKQLRVVKQVNLAKLNSKGMKNAIQEIKMMSEMKHFNIIRYRSHVIQKDILSILMDYADGGDVETLIKERNGRAWNEDIIIDYFVQMCLAIKYLHDRKIVHRDIKPSNFFICKNGIIKLGDFGLSHILPDTEAMLATQIGSPYYLSPEVCQGHPYNQKTDIWALGCILYEMCTLQRAFSGKSMKDVMDNIIKSKTPRIQKYYDLELQILAKQLLSKNPEKRPSINEVLSLPFIKYKTVALLGQTQAKIEFSHTIFHGIPPGVTPDEYPKEILFVDDYNDLKNEILTIIDQKDSHEKSSVNDCENNSEKYDGNPKFINKSPIISKNNLTDKGVGTNDQIIDEVNQKKDEYEFVEFMGFPMRLGNIKKSDSPQKKADYLREFIERLVGCDRFREMYSDLTKKKFCTLLMKYSMKKDSCIIKLIQKLILYEKQFGKKQNK